MPQGRARAFPYGLLRPFYKGNSVCSCRALAPDREAALFNEILVAPIECDIVITIAICIFDMPFAVRPTDQMTIKRSVF